MTPPTVLLRDIFAQLAERGVAVAPDINERIDALERALSKATQVRYRVIATPALDETQLGVANEATVRHLARRIAATIDMDTRRKFGCCE